MTVVGFTFSKISINRNAAIPKEVEIKSKINVFNIVEQDLKVADGKTTLRLEFTYDIEYAPKFADIHFGGHLLAVLEPKEAKEVLQKWKDDKKLDKDLRYASYNAIFHKCNVKAFELEEDFNLPLHLKLPQISEETVRSKK